VPKGWRKEQSRDPFFRRAKAEGYRARSAYKLLELDQRYHLLGAGKAVLDLGAAPGSWTQVALQRGQGRGQVVAVDLQAIEPLAGAATIEGDLSAPEVQTAMAAALPQGADLVLSDVSPKVSGIAIADHVRSVALAYASLSVAELFLRPGGNFVVKVFMGEDFNDFVMRARQSFARVHVFQPEASRDESRERYVVGLGYRVPRPAPEGMV
jgi:23S rRNA (uridine2552-2'-O)-methyltransferase